VLATSLLNTLIDLHTERWHSHGEQGVASWFIQNDHIALYALRCDGDTVAFFYALIQEPCVYFYLSGLDPHYQECSPGVVGLYFSLCSQLESHITTVDFLRGQESYKALWNVQEKVNYRIVGNRYGDSRLCISTDKSPPKNSEQ
jgi:CelD/BcsL family acetyltransferase involved in cellulose biosynthesis